MNIIDKETEFLDKKRIGYNLLRDAIKLVFEKNGKATLYKDIYVILAQKYNKTVDSVERDIRYILKKSGCNQSSKKFIKSVADKLLN